MKKKILLVSIAFPPKNDPEGLQVAKYFRQLEKNKDLQIDVVTSAIPTLNMPYDSNLGAYSNGVHQLINIPLKESRYINFVRNRLRLGEAVFPDAKYSFHEQSERVIKELKEKPDLIYSRADPKSSTIMAFKLKKEFKVPWILHMSDPWADCPIRKLSGKYYMRHDEWERKCLTAADIISLTSIPTINFYKRKYPEMIEKFRFYPNVFEVPEDKWEDKANTKSPHRKLKVVYTGGLVAERSPEYLLRPLNELYDENPNIALQLEVIIAGELDRRNRAVLQNYQLPFVKWVGRLPFKETIMLQRSADYLVAIDFPVENPEMAMFFPSKLLDYMVAQKRVLTLTVKGSAADQVMQDIKGEVSNHNDTSAIKQAFINAVNAIREENYEYFVNGHVPEKYEASYNANRLYGEMTDLISNKTLR